jgi:hypothetical protein
MLDAIYNLMREHEIPWPDWLHRGANGEEIADRFRLSQPRFEMHVDNLYRLRLCAPPPTVLLQVTG